MDSSSTSDNTAATDMEGIVVDNSVGIVGNSADIVGNSVDIVDNFVNIAVVGNSVGIAVDGSVDNFANIAEDTVGDIVAVGIAVDSVHMAVYIRNN